MFPRTAHFECLAHLVSEDLRHWQDREPFIVPGLPGLPGVPECPDYFVWNDWRYLIFSNNGVARYGMSREPFGPWRRPEVDAFEGPAAFVMKTAPFRDNRRIGVAWIGARENDKDDGPFLFGGNAVFRELVQRADGTLGTTFPAEMTPDGKTLSLPNPRALDANAAIEGNDVRIAARRGLAACECSGVPRNARVSLRVFPGPGASEFGLRLRSGSAFESGYDLRFLPRDRSVRLNRQQIGGVEGLDGPFALEVILRDDIIDACIGGSRTLIDRCPEGRGDKILLYAQDSAVAFRLLRIAALP